MSRRMTAVACIVMIVAIGIFVLKPWKLFLKTPPAATPSNRSANP